MPDFSARKSVPGSAVSARAALAGAFIAVCLVPGCATAPPASDREAMAEFRETNDPLEPTNRVFYAVNNGIDTVLLRPLAVAYRAALPQQVRNGVHNVLANLGNPVQLANDVLEARPRRAGDTLMRLLINTTIGLGGVFDVATDWGWPAHNNDGGMTLAMWGLPEGPFLFLLVLGPSSPREAAGSGIDYALSPTTYIGRGPTVNALGYARTALGALDGRSAVLDSLDKVKSQALDPYATIRSLYRQHRASQIEDAKQTTAGTVPAWFPAPSPKP